MVENILNIDGSSEIFLIQEVQDERYELLFGDGYIGKKLENESVITVQYIVTDGKAGNGIGGNNTLQFAGRILQLNTTDNTSYNIWGRTTNGGTAYCIHSGVTRPLSVKEIKQ